MRRRDTHLSPLAPPLREWNELRHNYGSFGQPAAKVDPRQRQRRQFLGLAMPGNFVV
jgi:hypothetical protein